MVHVLKLLLRCLQEVSRVHINAHECSKPLLPNLVGTANFDFNSEPARHVCAVPEELLYAVPAGQEWAPAA